jgi:nucleotide sugar dehydrogenase
VKIAVVGMGKIGLPIAVSFALKANSVIGVDIDKDAVEMINRGQEPFPGEFDLQANLTNVVKLGKLKATTDLVFSVRNSDVIVICIPLMLNKLGEPDFSNIDLLVADIGKSIETNLLISFETTLPVGTTRDRFTKILETESKRIVGRDFNVVFSPERVMTGRVFQDLRRYPKLVGGVTSACLEKGVDFYKSVMDFDARPDLKRENGVWEMENSEAAEFAKIAETTYRDVNIGLANEFAVYAKSKDIDIHRIIEAANSQPFSMIHTPGIAVGGHCIPIYPKFYSWGNAESQIVNAARERNSSMPTYALNQIKNEFSSLGNFKVGVLGITYRPGVKEVALSGALELLKLLKEEGASVYGDDPLLTSKEILQLGFEGSSIPENVDGLILHTAHSVYQDLELDGYRNLKFFFDGRNSHTALRNQHNFSYINI